MGESFFPLGGSGNGITVSNIKDSGIIQSTSTISGGKSSDNTYRTINTKKFTVNAGYGLMCILLTDIKAILQGGSVSGNGSVNLYMGIFLNDSSPSSGYIGQRITTFKASNTQYTNELVAYTGFDSSSYLNGSGFMSFCKLDVSSVTVYAQIHTGDGSYYNDVIPKIEFNFNAYVMDFM